MSAVDVKDQNLILTGSLLTTISEVMSSVASIGVEQENFMELGCYLHRTSPAIMELQRKQSIPPNVTEILQALWTKVDFAKDLVSKCSSGADSIMDDQLKSIIKQLEGVINNIGEDLSRIPASMFEKRKYAEIAVSSLSKEMKNVRFQMNGIQQSDRDESKLENPSTEEVEKKEEKNATGIQRSTRDESKLENLSTEEVEKKEEKNVIHNSNEKYVPRVADFLKGMYYGAHEHVKQSFNTMPQLAEYIEPLYESFFCPITKKIMDDPVTIESGITYERRAISEWFGKFKDGSEDLVCPITGMKLQSRVLNTNIALKTTIDEWMERNEATRIRVARTALSLASSDSMVLDAIRDLQLLSRKKAYNKQLMHHVGITKLLARFLGHEDMTVSCEALDLLRILVEDEEGKVIIVKTKAIAAAIKMLSSDQSAMRHASLSFLLELSKSEELLETIGSTPGGILMLITMKYNESEDPAAAGKAGETLKNLEKCSKNIKRMAENGLLEPLINHLVRGSEETQVEMVSYLSELILGNDMKRFVAERASESLIKMVHSGNTLSRKAAFKSLVQISSHHPNSETLVAAGVVPVMIQEMLTRRIYNEPTDSKVEAAAVLANILESGIDPETVKVNKHGHAISSHYSVYNIAHLLKRSLPDELNMHLVRILLSLTKLPRPLATVVSAIKETEGSLTTIEFLNSPLEELTIAAAKLLITLSSSHMGHTVAEGLCKTQGQPGNLIKKLDANRVTKKHAAAVNLVAKLPHQNLTLNLNLLHQGTVPVVLNRIQEIQNGETRVTRYAKLYLEGLVGVLLRFTTTLYDHEILQMAITQNLASVFTELLVRTAGSDEVQRQAALGLERLSSHSITLSRPPKEVDGPRKKTLLAKWRYSLRSQKEGGGRKVQGVVQVGKLCPVHRGSCSLATTFCLLEPKALEGLLGCLEHESAGVVEAALAAIATLLDERVDVERSVEVLSEVEGLSHVLGVLREHREEGVWQRAFWVIERFLMKGGARSASAISSDRELPSALVTAYHRGDSSTKQAAENILRHLNRMPHFSRNLIVV